MKTKDKLEQTNLLSTKDWIEKCEKVIGQKIDQLDFQINLDDTLLIDTYLSVKYHNPYGKDRWAHYMLFEDEAKSYRDIYTYFVEKKGFVAAYGYILHENEAKTHWLGQNRYFSFTRTKAPQTDLKRLEKPLQLIKPQYK